MSWWSFHALCTPVLHWNSPLEQKSGAVQPLPVLLPVPWEEVGAVPQLRRALTHRFCCSWVSREEDEESQLSFPGCVRAGYSGYSSVNWYKHQNCLGGKAFSCWGLQMHWEGRKESSNTRWPVCSLARSVFCTGLFYQLHTNYTRDSGSVGFSIHQHSSLSAVFRTSLPESFK